MEALLAQVLELAQQVTNMAEQQAAAEAAARRKVWLKVETLSSELGDAITPSRIRTDLRAGYFKEGVHYIRLSNGTKPGQGHYGFNPVEIRKVYETEPEKRRIY